MRLSISITLIALLSWKNRLPIFKAAEFRLSMMSLQIVWTSRACILGNQMTNRSEEHTSELQSLMRISYVVFCLQKKTHDTYKNRHVDTDTRIDGGDEEDSALNT